MDKEKSERNTRIYNWVRLVILVLFLTFVFVGLSKALSTNDSDVWMSASVDNIDKVGTSTYLASSHKEAKYYFLS